MVRFAQALVNGTITRALDLLRGPQLLQEGRQEAVLGRERERVRQYYATRVWELPAALDSFMLEYSGALAAADYEMLWDTHCVHQVG